MGNVGHEMGSLKTPTIAAYAVWAFGGPLRSYIFKLTNYDIDDTTSYALMILAAAWTFDNVEKSWRPKSTKSPSVIK